LISQDAEIVRAIKLASQDPAEFVVFEFQLLPDQMRWYVFAAVGSPRPGDDLALVLEPGQTIASVSRAQFQLVSVL